MPSMTTEPRGFLNGRKVDLVDDSYDNAIGIGKLPESGWPLESLEQAASSFSHASSSRKTSEPELSFCNGQDIC
ncbi:hypothetical protein [Noviherbaspirillum sp.]|uniref:hypothetical protein n=1 Tax=Noviherbaspirillum sp. TaxID=1926288 RepID=UPI002B488CF8|nr:hypothetical protein [Noviherbaspirillum sp.]HJV82205.1 hypothetical protein [Noviherbaspirillum sp.]